MQFSVEPDELGASSVPVSRAASAASVIDLAGDLAPLAAALPGSVSVRALVEASERWTAWVERLGAAAASQGASLAATADAYTGTEQAVRGRFATVDAVTRVPGSAAAPDEPERRGRAVSQR